MKNNFRVISVCSLMAAFATSSWAVDDNPACPASKGFVEVDGDCYYDIPETGGTVPLQLPSGVKTFTLRYQEGGTAFNDTINIFCEPQDRPTTVSVTDVDIEFQAASLSVRNRIDVTAYGAEDEAAAFLEDYQSTKDMFKCTGRCTSFESGVEKVTGFNALSIIFNSTSDGESLNKFDLTVNQEPYDFGPMQVYNVKGLDKDNIDDLVTKATLIVGLDDMFIPLAASQYGVDASVLLAVKAAAAPLLPVFNGISAVLARNFSNAAFIEGASDNGLVDLTQDIVVDSVYLDRTFTTNDEGDARSTIAFPFDISSDAIEGASEILQFTRVGKVDEDNYAVFMKKVYCADPTGDKCPATNGTLEAYKPYIVQLKSGVTSLQFNGPVTLKATPSESGYADFKCQNNSNWVFRGVFKKIAWNDEAPDNVYGYAAEGDYKGQFVKAGKGAYILPFRGFLIYLSPLKIAPANSSYALRPNVLPDEMNIVIEGDNNETTVIGKFNTRTGEMNFINNMKHTYDLKGRRVNGTNNARGAYYGKKVLMK